MANDPVTDVSHRPSEGFILSAQRKHFQHVCESISHNADRIVRENQTLVKVVNRGLMAIVVIGSLGLGLLVALSVGILMNGGADPITDKSKQAMFDQQLEVCYSLGVEDVMPCIETAQITYCQFVPLPVGDPNYVEALDGRCP